jgi:opacity protein-like surface antigen
MQRKNIMAKSILLLLILFNSFAIAQGEINPKLFSLSVAGGVSISNPINWYFYESSDYDLINPGLYGNMGFEFGPITILDLSQLYLSTTIGYTSVSIPDHKLRYDNSFSKLKIETLPILFWIRLQTNSKLSPFIEVGLGASRLQFEETYSVSFINDATFSYWAFGYGLGAGLKYSLSDEIDISLAVQQLTNEKENIVEANRSHRTGILVRNVVVPIFLRVNVRLL